MCIRDSGRVESITANEIVLEQGSVPSTADTLYVDCTADGLATRPPVPVFDDRSITLQAVRTCQQVFSAAFIAHVEASYDDEGTKNELATVVPHPDTADDWMRVTLANGLNSARWRADADLTTWLEGARLDAFSQLRSGGVDVSAELDALTTRANEAAMSAAVNLQQFLAEAAEN